LAGTITLVYDHHSRGLSEALLELQHRYHQLVLSTMHLHLDHHNCLETLIVKCRSTEAKELANCLLGLKGVKHGKLTIASTGRRLS